MPLWMLCRLRTWAIYKLLHSYHFSLSPPPLQKLNRLWRPWYAGWFPASFYFISHSDKRKNGFSHTIRFLTNLNMSYMWQCWLTAISPFSKLKLKYSFSGASRSFYSAWVKRARAKQTDAMMCLHLSLLSESSLQADLSSSYRYNLITIITSFIFYIFFCKFHSASCTYEHIFRMIQAFYKHVVIMKDLYCL